MISDNYKQEMLKEARQLDRLLGQGSDFEKLVHEITDQQMDLAVLELIKKLGVLTKNQILEGMEQRQDRMIKILFKYLGAFKVDGCNR